MTMGTLANSAVLIIESNSYLLSSNLSGAAESTIYIIPST
jgi:hypothetical protein